MIDSTPQYTIGHVAKRTGLSAHVLRVWERRYSAVTPGKTETRRRLYSDADIARLKLLRTLSEAGHSIGRIASLPTADLKKLLRDLSEPDAALPRAADASDATQTAQTGALLGACCDAIRRMDPEALDVALNQAKVHLPLQLLLDDVIGPLMRWVGDQWHAGALRVAHEHLTTAAVKGFLTRIRQSSPPSKDAPLIVVATPAGEQHEIGALLAAVIANAQGWRHIYFGPNLPAAELANAAIQSGAAIVALSIARPGDSSKIMDETEELRNLLPSEIGIVAGGEGAARYGDELAEAGVRYVSDLRSLGNLLTEMRRG